MAIKNLVKSVKPISVNKGPIDKKSDMVDKFISKGGTLTNSFEDNNTDHRLTLRIPKWLMEKVDLKRKERIGKISRNLWILEILERAAKEE
jgi:hypothetical protein